MPLDSLGLGLTLDTTLLEKADKTLENMHKNSKLIMQNLTRGFTSFNSGGADALTKMSTALGHVSDALTKIDNAKVSPDFDTKGQEKYINRMQQLLDIVEKMSKISGAKFYDPTEVYATDKDASDIFAEIEELKEYKDELKELIDTVNNYGEVQSKLSKKAREQKEAISKQEEEVKKLAKTYKEAEAKFNSSMEALSKFRDEFFDSKRKKKPSLTDEEIQEMYSSSKSKTKSALLKQLEDERVAINEAMKSLDNAYKDLAKKREALSKTTTEYKENRDAKNNIERIKIEYNNLREREKILRAELKFAQATQAERAAMLTKKNEVEIKADQKRIRDVQKSYEQLRKEIQKGEKDIADLEASRQTLKEANRPTKGIDNEIKKRRNELNKLMQDELEFRSSQYWPKLQAIDEKFNSEAFIKNQKALAKLAAKESRKDVTAALQFSRNAQTINEEKEAIKRLVEARDNLSTSTARYKKTVEDINKRILAHKDHIEAVTRVEKEQNTLADSVINRYRKQLKALDEVNEALKKQMKIERKTSVADLDPNNADTQALLARQKTITDDIKAIEKSAQGELDIIREQHDAERAKKRIDETLRQNEREKQEYAKLLDDLYAIEKQKKSMEDAGAKSGDKAYDNILQQEQDLNNRISQLKAKHQNDLDEIDKKHAKKRNDDDVKAFIDAQKEKQRIAEEYAKKQREKAKKYGTISNASAERLIGVADKAQNVNQHKLAIEKLTQARNSLNITDKDYLKTVKKLNDAIRWHHIEVEIAEDKSKGLMQTHRGLMDIGGQLMRRLALVFSVSQLTQYFRKLVEVRGEFEKQEVALQTLLKSKYQANILMQQVTDLAVKSPFTLQQLIGYTKQLAAYQIEYKKLYSTTKMLADVSAGLGVEMDRLILAFGQVRAANYLRATEVRQFTEAGMDILGELAKYYSELEGKMVSVADVQERVTKRMVGFSDVEEVFKRVTSAGGIFYDMQAKQAETLSGQWSNLQDKIGIMFNEIGKGTDGLLKGIVRFLASIVDNWEKASTVLTALVGSFVTVKINTALASKELIKFVRTMGLIKGRVKSVTILQTLGAIFVKLGKSIKSAALAMKGFAVSHPIITALTLLATLIGAVYKEWNRQEEAAKNVRKQYDELSESVEKLTVAFNRMGREGDFEGQKKQLEELVTLANNEYQMNIKVNLKGATAEEVAQQFIDLQQKMLLLNSFATDFNTDYAQSGKSTEKSMKKYGEVAKETLKSLVQDAERVAFTLDKLESEGVKLTESQIKARNKLAEPRQIDESELDYLQRLMGAFSLLTYEYENMEDERAKALQGLDFDSEEYTKTAMDFTRSLIDIQDRMSEMGLSIGDITKIYSKYNKAQGEAIKKYNEFLDKVEVPSFLSDEGKEERIKFAIDTYAAQNQWDEFMINLAYDLANKKFVINITPTVDEDEGDVLKKWQETYNKRFANSAGFRKIGKSDTTQAQQIEVLNDELEKNEKLLKRIQEAGGVSATLAGGAYEGEDINKIEQNIKEINEQLDWFGYKDKKTEKDNKKILKNRIALLEEMHKKYLEIKKDKPAAEAEEQVRTSFADTFREAFEGTGINLSGLVIDKDKLRELQEKGSEAGQVFSKAMIEKMNEVAESGTYIRSLGDSFDKVKEKLKVDEGFVGSIYDDRTKEGIKTLEDLYKYFDKVTGKIINNPSLGTLTIGYGHSLQTLEEAKKYLGITLSQSDAEKLLIQDIRAREGALNGLLNKYDELIITQEQYNVLFNNVYQGGLGDALKRAASDIGETEKYIKVLDDDLKGMGTSFEEQFGGDWLDKYKELPTFAERFAMQLEIAALTTKKMNSHIDPTLFEGMKDRSAERAAAFRGELEIVKLLNQASVDITKVDFTSEEGMVAFFKRLTPLAQKEGKDAMLALSKVISEYEASVGIRVRTEDTDALFRRLDEMFEDYETSIEIKKLNAPDGVLEKIFNVEKLDLKSLKKKFLEELDLEEGLDLSDTETILAAARLKYGDDAIKEIEQRLKQIRKLEDKELKDSATRFVKFLTKNLDQTKVIMSQRGVDIAFAKEQFDKGEISAEHFAETVKNIVAQSNEEISKFNLDKFKESAEYIQAMGDLSSYSKKEIQGLIKTLNDAVTQNAHLFDADEVKAYMDALKKAQEELESRDVFDWGEFGRAADIIQTQKEIEDKKVDIANNKATLETQKEKLKELEQELERLKTQKETESKAGKDTKDTEGKIEKKTQEIVEANEGIEQTNSNIKTNTGLLSLLGDKMKGLAGNMGTTLGIIDAIVHGINDTVQGINTIYGEIGSVMESFGKETDFSTGFGKGAMLMDTFAKSSQAAADGWDAFKSGDPVGVVVNVVKSITEIIKGINAYHDAGLEVIIQDHLEEVERLQKEYEKLEWAIDRAFSFDKYGKVAEQTKNLGKQIENTSKAIALEEDKKDTDEERIKELRENAEEARRQIHELYDNLRQEIVGSYEDLSSTLADAMIEALKNGEDALKAWGDEVDNIIANIVTKLAVQKYVEPQVSRVLDQFYNKVMPKNAAAEKAFTRLQSMTVGTAEYENALAEWERLNSQAIGELPQLTESSVNALKESLNAVGVSFEPIAEQIAGIFGGQGGGLSALQKGIQGVTEQTAQVLEALLNSMRDTQANSYSELQSQTNLLRDIKGILNDLTSNSPQAVSVKFA
jgi:hypothetical protein